MERVSATSASLLRLDSPAAHLHVGWLARVDAHTAGALDVGALRTRIAARLDHAPRLRAIVSRPQEHGELVWEQAADFSIERQVVAWPGDAAGEEELRVVVDRFLEEPLPHEQPLWRVLVVPRTRAGGALLAGKLHRALADGHDTDLLRDVVFDATPPAGTASQADAEALTELRAHRRLRETARAAAAAPRIGETLRRAALARTEGTLAAASPSFLDGTPQSARRTLVTARTDLGRLARIAQRTETTLHGVVLAVLTGTVRRLALARGEQPRDLRALVPLQVGERGLLGDTPCAVVALPIAEPRAAARLGAVHAALEAATRARGSGTTDPHAENAPTVIAGPPEELASRLALAARVSNLTIPSSSGPARALHVDGARVRALFPLTSIPDEHALALATLVYERHLHVGAAADAAVLTTIGRLPVLLADSVQELGVSTGADTLSRGVPRRFGLA